jgi:cyclic pyranopterin phosphate synthase
MRVSVTDRCNFRCRYCMPETGFQWIPHADILRYEEILRIIDAGAKLGIDKIRITGGEPLLRKGLVSFVQRVVAIPGINEVSLTTNGSMLTEYAGLLRDAGIRRINISLDTMKRERFLALTGKDGLDQVLAGIKKAEEVGLFPIKINMVVMKGFNDDEVAQFAAWTKEKPYEIRFIEYMPFGQEQGYLMKANEIQARLAAEGYGSLIPEAGTSTHVKRYRLPAGKGDLGFITPVSQHFCDSCNRIRLTAEGYLKLCLFSNRDYLLREDLRRGISDEQLAEKLKILVYNKPRGHSLEKHEISRFRMSQIGG